MSSQFQGKFERSSFGTQGAKAARRSVSSVKAQSLVSRAKSNGTPPKNPSWREGK